MSKAILITDMPKSCKDCELAMPLQCYTIITLEEIPNMHTKRLKACPLKSMPEKKRTRGKESENNMLCFNAGYNACLDEIMKEEKTV